MEIAIPATEARKNFAEILDDAIVKPVFINRRKNDYLTFSTNQLLVLLPITPQIEGVDKDFVASINEVPQVLGFGTTVQGAVEDLSLALMDYSNIYLADFDNYYKAPNTQTQALYAIMFKDITPEKFKEKFYAKLERT